MLSTVVEAIESVGYPDLKTVRCSNDEGLILLQGRVRSYYLKQIAQTAAMNVTGVNAIENRLRVDGQ